jgi:hypothetical protein
MYITVIYIYYCSIHILQILGVDTLHFPRTTPPLQNATAPGCIERTWHCIINRLAIQPDKTGATRNLAISPTNGLWPFTLIDGRLGTQ